MFFPLLLLLPSLIERSDSVDLVEQPKTGATPTHEMNDAIPTYGPRRKDARDAFARMTTFFLHNSYDIQKYLRKFVQFRS